MKEKTFEVIFANGKVKAKATTLIKAVKKMKIKKSAEIGMLVQVRENGINSYWSGLQFIKYANLTQYRKSDA